MLKTYGTKNYMEWQALISVGKAKVSVPFTGGMLTGNGVTPATYTTSNKVLQKVIENSAYYKSGKIYLVRQIAEPESTPSPASVTAGKGTGSSSRQSIPEHPETPESPDGAKEDADTPKQVEVSDLDAAKSYLMETFGVRASDLRSKAAIQSQAKAHGIELVGLN